MPPSATRKFWRLCKTYYGCGTPLASDTGTAGLLEGNVEKAKALLKEAGYDGRPIVLLQVTDLASLANLGPVAKAQLERVGFKVDMRPADWQTPSRAGHAQGAAGGSRLEHHPVEHRRASTW